MEADISEKVFSYIGIKDYEKLSLLLFEEVSLSPEKLNFPDWHFGSGSIPIIQTVINEDIDSCRVLLEVGASPNVQDIQGLSPAHHAVQLRNFELLQLLISRGADVNIEDHLLGRTPLHTLCYSLASNKPLSNEKVNIFHLLLEYSDVNTQTKINKNTPLHILSFKNSHLESIIKPLSTHPHINIDAVNEDGQTPLIIALENNFDELASFFIGIGSNLSSVNRHGETSLLIACRKNQVRLVLEMLETNKCPTRSRDIDNNTSFHLAASRGFYDIVRILIVFSNFRIIRERNKMGKTPMELARDGQFNSVVQLFQGKDSRNERNASL
ncbi:putative ankyrin repeat protein YahD [Lepeophtheirus salmonis]|nr:serine/threonine-protein phosphatase 6 regulatory ankyrin repeat subunit B-like isoform X2 [Lepeophtheirus salmonis]